MFKQHIYTYIDKYGDGSIHVRRTDPTISFRKKKNTDSFRRDISHGKEITRSVDGKG